MITKKFCIEELQRNKHMIVTKLRPGPLSAGMHTAYAKRKSGEEEATSQLRGTEAITEDTYNTIIYQEQCMLISKLVAGFDDSQADSILRKALA